jgi:hypothetical protein
MIAQHPDGVLRDGFAGSPMSRWKFVSAFRAVVCKLHIELCSGSLKDFPVVFDMHLAYASAE